MVAFCTSCNRIFLDGKHLADHQWMSRCLEPPKLASVCEEHKDVVGVVNSESLKLEKMLHRSFSHWDCPFPGLRVDFPTLQEDFLLQPEYASLCGDENSLCVKANGYKYKSRVAAAYIIPSHHIRIPCAETECPSFGILIGRHTVSRLELIMYLRSKLSHTHGPCLAEWEPVKDFSEIGDSVFFGNIEFKANQDFPDERMRVYKCVCCPKLIVKEINRFWHDPQTPHWNRMSQADLSVEVESNWCDEFPDDSPHEDYSKNLEYGLDILKKQISDGRSLRSVVIEGCKELAAFHKPRWAGNPPRATCIISGVELYFRFTPDGKFLRRQEKQWVPVCDECFNVAKDGKCTTHLRTVTEISVYSVRSAKIDKELAAQGILNAAVYYVGKKSYGLNAANRTVYVFEENATAQSSECEMSKMQKMMTSKDKTLLSREIFTGEGKESSSSKYSSALKIFLHLLAISREGSSKPAVILNWFIAGEPDWNLVFALLEKNNVRFQFETTNIERKRGSEQIKFDFREFSDVVGYLYVLNIEETGYIGASETNEIAKVHRRESDGISLDGTNWGKHLRKLNTTHFRSEVFAQIPHNLLTIESLAILTFFIGARNELMWARGFESISKIVNVNLQFPDLLRTKRELMNVLSIRFFGQTFKALSDPSMKNPLF